MGTKIHIVPLSIILIFIYIYIYVFALSRNIWLYTYTYTYIYINKLPAILYSRQLDSIPGYRFIILKDSDTKAFERNNAKRGLVPLGARGLKSEYKTR